MRRVREKKKDKGKGRKVVNERKEKKRRKKGERNIRR